jgi:diguanylate cyclase (GGDEF)-like protein
VRHGADIDAAVSHRVRYALGGLALSLGAPLGLSVVRAAAMGAVLPARLRAAVRGDPHTYAYVAGSTAVVFTLFGYLLGRQADRLAELATTDALTGLANARFLETRLRQEVARADRYLEPLALLLIDLDGLKVINDRHGHAAGDRAIGHVGAAIRRELRTSDVGARWGGDEFALLAPDTDTHGARLLGERVRTLVASDPTLEWAISLTVSVGVAAWEPGAARPPAAAALMAEADRALYRAKRAGRNRVEVAGSEPSTPAVHPHVR